MTMGMSALFLLASMKFLPRKLLAIDLVEVASLIAANFELSHASFLFRECGMGRRWIMELDVDILRSQPATRKVVLCQYDRSHIGNEASAQMESAA